MMKEQKKHTHTSRFVFPNKGKFEKESTETHNLLKKCGFIIYCNYYLLHFLMMKKQTKREKILP